MGIFDKTATYRVVISRAAGLHAPPSLAVAQTVQRYHSQVLIRTASQVADASSVLELLSLGAGQGRELTLVAKGPDAQEVMDALRQLFEHDFGLEDE